MAKRSENTGNVESAGSGRAGGGDGGPRGGRRALALAAVMAALSNLLSMEPFAVPVSIGPFASRVHLSQLPIFLAGCLGGARAGLLAGAVGGLYMGVTVIPFIVGGLGLLGFVTGYLARRFGLRPLLSSLAAFGPYAVYVSVTDYVWFTSLRMMPPAVAVGVVSGILLKLALEAVVAAILAEVLVLSVRRTGLSTALGIES